MQKPKTICVVDDEIFLASTLAEQLTEFGYKVETFFSAEELLEKIRGGNFEFDAVVSDVYLKELTGFDLCRLIRSSYPDRHIPVILTSGNDLAHEKTKSFDVGADDFVAKPFYPRDLQLRLGALLKVTARIGENREQLQAAQLRIDELSGQRKCTMPATITNLANPAETLLFCNWSRKNVSAVFVDLRDFTAFTEASAPEVVMAVVSRYYSAIGKLAKRFGGTLCSLVGDGVAVIFNNSGNWKNHQEAAAKFSLALREDLNGQKDEWLGKGYELNYGIAIADGYVTIGTIGCDYLGQYIVIGGAMNLASRLCSLAKEGEILASHRFYVNLPSIASELKGQFELKGVPQPVKVYNALAVRERAAVGA